jgi:hypothetical protein
MRAYLDGEALIKYVSCERVKLAVVVPLIVLFELMEEDTCKVYNKLDQLTHLR